MTDEQAALLRLSEESLEAARLLVQKGIFRFATPRAYYAMFYCAEALLLTKGLAYSKHAGVIAAFGRELANPGLMPVELHRILIEAAELREDCDYDAFFEISETTAGEQIVRAEQFLNATRAFLGTKS